MYGYNHEKNLTFMYFYLNSLDVQYYVCGSVLKHKKVMTLCWVLEFLFSSKLRITYSTF